MKINQSRVVRSLIVGFLFVGPGFSGVAIGDQTKEWAWCGGFVASAAGALEAALPKSSEEARQTLTELIPRLNDSAKTMITVAMGTVMGTGITDMDVIKERVDLDAMEGAKEAQRLIGGQPVLLFEEDSSAHQKLVDCLQKNAVRSASPGTANATVSPADLEVRLSVQTMPSNARVRIMNITPMYSAGIALEPGRYDIEVSAPGYQTHRRWYELAAGDQVLEVTLEQKAVAVGDTLPPGEYFYFDDGSCTPHAKRKCVDRQTWLSLCGKSNIELSGFVVLAFGNYNSRFRELSDSGVRWKLNRSTHGNGKCDVEVTVRGLLYGTTTVITSVGSVTGFRVNDNGSVVVTNARYLYER